MTIRYVGPGGNDINSGLSWSLRKLTLSGVEATPVVAGDLVYVGPGTYRETLTMGVSGTAGNPIEYRGDYLGTNTDGVGGVCRITGSDNDQTAARNVCITDGGSARNYRTFTGFKIDMPGTGQIFNGKSGGTNVIIQQCCCEHGSGDNGITLYGSGQNHIIQNCFFTGAYVNSHIYFSHTSTVANGNNLVQNCIFQGSYGAVGTARVGGITVKNCVGAYNNSATNGFFFVATALAGGSTCAVNNCIIYSNRMGILATVTTEVLEDYNTFLYNGADRSNTNSGANSITYPPFFDPRWFFQLALAGAGPNSPLQVLSPFDLASYSQLVNLAGTSPATTDLRGTAVQGAQREWGALEYDSTLLKDGATKSYFIDS